MSSLKDVKEIAASTNRKYDLMFSVDSSKDFEAVNKAIKYMQDQGYNIGSMQREAPIACSKHAGYIAKWRNIDRSEWDRVEAVIVSNDMRNGPNVSVYKFE